jgi:pteridine reductase
LDFLFFSLFFVLHYHSSEQAAQQTQKLVEAHNQNCELIQADLSKPAQLEKSFSELFSRQQVSLLINNALSFIADSLQQNDPQIATEQWQTNFFALHKLIELYVKSIKGEGYGQVINVTDNQIVSNKTQYSSYLMSKNS